MEVISLMAAMHPAPLLRCPLANAPEADDGEDAGKMM